MELVKGRENKVYLEGPATWNVNATIQLNNAEAAVLPTPIHVGDSWVVTVPHLFVEDDVTVNWIINTGLGEHTHSDFFKVVTPYLTRREIRSFWEDASDDEIDTVERAVRHIINAHTGQTFGRHFGTYRVSGNGTRSILLPHRLFRLNKINSVTSANALFDLGGDGWYLKIAQGPWPPGIKADLDGLHQHRGGMVGPVIHNPNHISPPHFLNEFTYTLEGWWGWETVPPAVKESALLLVNDYAGSDAQYRDRYLTSMIRNY